MFAGTRGSIHVAAFGCIALALCSARPTFAQPVWNMDMTTSLLWLNGHAVADDYVPTPAGIADDQTDFVHIWQNSTFMHTFLTYGTDFSAALFVTAAEFDPIVPTFTGATARPFVLIYGLGTDTVTIAWFNLSSTSCDAADGYDAIANTITHFNTNLYMTGWPAGTPVDVHYQYWLFSATRTQHELFIEDFVQVRQANLYFNGQNFTADRFDLFNEQAMREYRSPVFVESTVVGQWYDIAIHGETRAEIHMPGKGPRLGIDSSSATWYGVVTLKLVPAGELPADLLPTAEQPGLMDFSVDISGDCELSDPAHNGNEVFDPGDIYPWHGPAMTPPGANGRIDDRSFWSGAAGDPAPRPNPLTGPAPVCSGIAPPLLPATWFDLDGHDEIDVSLADLIPGGTVPRNPVAYFQSSCIFYARYLALSFDDDGAQPYSLCEVPVNTSSPAGLTHGGTAARDEVVGLTLDLFSTPLTVARTYGIASEMEVHISLAPNASVSRTNDDDVDSLDIPYDALSCTTVLFSVDHETHFPRDPAVPAVWLNPGDIYEAVPGGLPMPVIDHALHLGLIDGVDVRDFELAWLFDPNSQGDVLALLFSVARDDPATPEDESGGLDPRMIYRSYLTGASWPLLTYPLEDDIDGLACWYKELRGSVLCPGDNDYDGDVDQDDLDAVLFYFGQSVTPTTNGDIDGDGDVDQDDLDIVLFNFGMQCV